MSTILSDLRLDPTTAEVLTQFARRRRVLVVLRGVASGLIFLAASMLLIAYCDYLWLLSDGVRWLLSLVAYAIAVAATWWFGLRLFACPDPKLIARQLETADPSMREDLLSAVELADPHSANGSESFRQRLQRSVAQRTERMDVSVLLPVGLVSRWLTAGGIVVALCCSLLLVPDMQFGRRIARALLPGLAIERASLTEVMIIEPSPASGNVAEGDAVGVVVQLAGSPADEVQLRWRSFDGMLGETVMSQRVMDRGPKDEIDDQASASDSMVPADAFFAANLAVGKSPLQYQIVAGDAITLWHKLTPLPRPRVESFTKRYVFPTYSKLEDRVEEQEHGDLRALVGTTVELTVRFDEPVDQATLRFGHRGVVSTLQPIDESDREFSTTIPIKTPSQYQVDAISARSGFNNPFSPQYAIIPVVDTAPTVHWSDTVPKTNIVSPIDVVSLLATATDDLPMDHVLQEFQINGDPLIQRDIAIGKSGRELRAQWDWDLMRRIDSDEVQLRLSGGDIVRTRVVAIDRLGNRGESKFIELLIAEDSFNSDRHRRLDELDELTAAITSWTQRVGALMEQAREPAERFIVDKLHQAAKNSIELHEQMDPVIDRIKSIIATSPASAEASRYELIGRAVMDVDQRIRSWFARAQHAIDDQHPAWHEHREKHLDHLVEESKKLGNQASRIEQYAKALLGEELSVGITADVMALQRSLEPMVNDDSNLPMERFPRYLTVAIGRLEAVETLVDSHREQLPQSTPRQLEQWNRWVEPWASRLRSAVNDANRELQLRPLVRQFQSELSEKPSTLLDGNLAATLKRNLGEIRTEVGATSDLVTAMESSGSKSQRDREQAEREHDSDRIAASIRDAEYADDIFGTLRDQLVARLRGEESLHRARPYVDLQYAADMKLMSRAMKNVTSEGFAPYRDEPASVLHQKLAQAFRIIEAKHEADMRQREISELMASQRRLEPTAVAKIKHPSWCESFAVGLEWPIRTLQNCGLQWKDIERIDQSRYNDDFSQANRRLAARRWTQNEMQSAELPLGRITQQLALGLNALEPRVVEARQTIQQYVLTLPQQARQAAEKARQAERQINERPDSKEQTTDELAKTQTDAQQAASETIEALIDFANTAEITSEPQRQLAHDADAAAAQVRDAMERASQNTQRATDATEEKARSESLEQAADALSDLSDVLEQTANHFERANNDQDVSASRDQLRSAERELKIAHQLEQRFARAEAMAETARRSPEALMKLLEKELQRNEPMQEELSEIAEQAVKSAQRSLRQAARDESAINQSMERSDPSFQQRKALQAQRLRSLAESAAVVDQTLLNAAEYAITSAETPDAKPELQSAREQIRDAVAQSNQMGGDNAPLEKMEQTARDMAKTITDAAKALEKVAEYEANAADQDIHRDVKERKRKQQEMQRLERVSRNSRIQYAKRQQLQWTSAERDAGRKVSDAQRNQRDAEREKQVLEERLKQEVDNQQAIEQAMEQVAQRVRDAQRAESAARERLDVAKEQVKAAAELEKQIQKERLAELDKPNPAAELTHQMAQKAKEELATIAEHLEQIGRESDFGDELRISQPQAESLAKQQERVAEAVADAADQLQRAARHEERLENDEMARDIADAAQSVQQGALAAANQATGSVRDAIKDARKTPQANQRVVQAQQQIAAAAEQLAQILAQSSSQSQTSSESRSDEASSDSDRAEQLAQTLDELDRALSSTNQSQSQSGSPGRSPRTAAEASLTLSAAIESQAQRAARQRLQQMNLGNQGESSQGSKSDQSASSAEASTESGSGEMPDGGSVATANVDREGAEWGQLRQQRTEDATESSSARIAPQYRREIDAYFRAIARKAAERP